MWKQNTSLLQDGLDEFLGGSVILGEPRSEADSVFHVGTNLSRMSCLAP